MRPSAFVMIPLLLLCVLSSSWVQGAENPPATAPSPSPSPTVVVTPSSTPGRAAPGKTYMLDRVGLALGVFGKIGSDSGKRAKYLAGSDGYYEDLNRRLDDVLGIPRHEPTEAEKTWAVVGQAVGYSCAAIAAAQVLDEALGKRKKKGK